MKRYEIELDNPTSNFFEEIAAIAERPVGEILSSMLFNQAEIISRKVSQSAVTDDKS